MRLLAVCVGSCLLTACGGTPGADRTVTREVEAQLAIARDATIPTGVTLLGSSGPTREAHSVSAEWSFEVPTDWHRYLDQAEAALRRAGYERGTTSDDARVFGKHVPGDSYRVQIARDAAAATRRLTVTFRAGPD